MNQRYWSLLLFCFSFTLMAQTNLPYEDRTFSSSVRTVLLNPGDGQKDAVLPAIIELNSGTNLYLSFDILGNTYESLIIRIVHCNSDWTASNVNSSLFMNDVNDVQIQQVQNSFNTRVNYQHYSTVLPHVQMSGNYIALVYRSGNEEDVLLTRRFMVYQENLTITPMVKSAYGVADRATSQQADFNILWAGSNVVNPMLRLKPVIRQNFQWYSTIEGLSPSMPRENEGIYEYFYFNGESTFKGINEFRFFDLRSLKTVGMNVDRVEQSNDKNDAFLLLDHPRKGMTYSTITDLNGQFVPEHYETKGYTVEPDYVNVTFFLEAAPMDYAGRIFVFGALSDWKLNQEFEMIYDKELKLYRCTVLLKQGFYNYCYTFLPDGENKHDISRMEGSFFNTENSYDFLVYYRPPGKNYDLLIGYKTVNYMGR